MACLAHTCRQCRREWFDNDMGGECPGCGSTDFHTDYDEPMGDYDEYYEDDFAWEDEE